MKNPQSQGELGQVLISVNRVGGKSKPQCQTSGPSPTGRQVVCLAPLSRTAVPNIKLPHCRRHLLRLRWRLSLAANG